MAGERQVEWVHCNNQKKQIARNQQASKLYNPWTPSPRRRDPNAMDTSADRGRANAAETSNYNNPENSHKDQVPMPPFAPREGYIRRQGDQRDMRGVQCFNCQKFGHFARNCFQKRKPPTLGEGSKARVADVDPKGPTAEECTNDWLKGIGKESDEVKDLVLQTMWKREDFPHA